MAEIFVPQSVLDAVLALANAFGWDEQQQVIEQHQTELLGEYADYALLWLLEQYEGQPHATMPLEDLRQLLDDCREAGVSEAFARRRRAGRAGLRPGVLDQLGAMTEDQTLVFLVRSPGVQRLFLEAAVALVEASTPEAKRAVLRREQDLLLNPAAEVVLRANADIPGYEVHAGLLASARAEGIDAAIDHMFGGDGPRVPGVSDEVNAILQELAFAERFTTIERRVELTRRGLELVEPETPLWASFHSLLGNALLESYGTDRGERLEEAIAGFEATLAFAERHNRSAAASSAHEDLARAHLERIVGDRTANVERAVREAEAAVELAENGSQLVSAGYQAAMAYLELESGDRADHLRRAHEHAQAALAVVAEGPPDAEVALRQALALIAYRGGPDDDGDGGRAMLRRAADLVDADESPDNWVRIRIDLGRILVDGDADDIEEGISVLESALTFASPERQPERWADVHSRLGRAYRWRVAGDRSANLEQAIEHSRQALTVYTRADFPEFWAEALDHLADALRLRLHGNPEVNARRAIDYYTELLDYFDELGSRSDWAEVQMDLGRTYLNNNRVGLGELENAWTAYGLALAEFERLGDAGNAAEAHGNLLSVGTRWIWAGRTDEEFVATVVGHGEHALAYYVRDRHPDEYVITQLSLGTLHYQLDSHDPARLAAAALHLENGLSAVTPFTVMEAFDGHDALAEVRFRMGDVDGALATLESQVGEGERLLAKAVTEETQRKVLAELGAAYTRACYLELRRGNRAEALRLIERGRSRLLLETLGAVDLASLEPGARSRVERARERVEQTRNALNSVTGERDAARLGRALGVARAELADALAAVGPNGDATAPTDPWRLPNGAGALVVPVVTWFGLAAFVLPPGVGEITERHVLELDCTRADLAGAEYDWMNASNRMETGQGTFAEWAAAVERVTAWLWTAVAGPLCDRLTELGVAGGTPLRLMSSQLTNQLPLHAAWREENGERRSLLDDYPIAYTPGIRMLHEAHRRAERRAQGGRTALLVADSTGDLPHAVDEVRSISRLFPDGSARTLIGPDATSDAIFSGVAGRAYVHFACHAFANWFQPNYSSLVLADGEMVVAGELAGLELDETRLVVLSACQSGMEVVESASDYTGIAAALLRAGSPTVIATLWNVNDHASSLLMRHFYEELLSGDHATAVALQRAQLWLRDATVAELSAYDTSAAGARKWRMLGADSTDRPYANPYFWAGYFLIGA